MTTSNAKAKKVTLSYKAAHVKAQQSRNTAKQARRLQVKPSVSLNRPSEYKNNMAYWQGLSLKAALKASRVKPVYVSQYEALSYVPNEVVAVSEVKTSLHHTLFSPFAFELITSTVVNYALLGIKKHAKKAAKNGNSTAKGSGAYVGKAYGVKYPAKVGGANWLVWQYCDKLKNDGIEPNGGLLKAWAIAGNTNINNASSELWAWRKYQARLTA